MKKGINYWSFDRATTMAEALQLAKQAGFDGLEFCLAEDGEVSLTSTESDLHELRKRAEDLEVELPSVASWLVWENNLVSDDESIRRRATDIIKVQIETARILGADTVLVVPGYVGADFIPGSSVVDYGAAYDRAQASISELGAYAATAGVKIGVENVWNKFLLSPLEMRRFIDEIANESVGAYFDIGNALLTGYPEQWIRILGPRIFKVHVKDYRRSPGGFDSFVDLLAGDVNFPEVVAALEQIGYNSYCTAEMMPTYRHYPDQMAFNASAAMDRIFEWDRGAAR
jgi:L-ribulose-5-phosphate 3-epimerase